MKNLIAGIILAANTYMSVNCQTLKIGDLLPQELIADAILNVPGSGLNLSALKRKLIILDFWNTSCISCIASFPHLDSLQQKFSKDLQIILVNKQGYDSVNRFFALRKKIFRPALPMITGDTLLHSLFSSEGYPYSVWIDSDKKITNITEGYLVNEKNVAAYISGDNNAVPKTINVHYGSLFLLSEADAGNAVKYYSHMADCIDSINIGTQYNFIPETNGLVRIACNCYSMEELFKIAYAEFNKYNFVDKESIAITCTHKRKVKNACKKYIDSIGSARFSYELSMPSEMSGKAFDIMKKDLLAFFDLEARVIFKRVESYVLVKNSTRGLPASTGGTAEDHFHFSGYDYPGYDSVKYAINIPFSRIAEELRNWITYYTGKPFYDRASINYNIDIAIASSAVDPLDIASLNRELKKYGLKITREKIRKEVLKLKIKDSVCRTH